jgi:hypothetical protein
MVTYQDVKGSRRIRTCISAGHTMLGEIGFTEHGFAHAQKVSDTAAQILTRYGGKPREVELARIAGFMHDIGNMVNRNNHALTGGVIAFQILSEMGMEPEEVAMIVTAIGNHDEGTGNAVSRIAAALILADKSDCSQKPRARAKRRRIQRGHSRPRELRRHGFLPRYQRGYRRHQPAPRHRHQHLSRDRIFQDLHDTHVHVQGRVRISRREVLARHQQTPCSCNGAVFAVMSRRERRRSHAQIRRTQLRAVFRPRESDGTLTVSRCASAGEREEVPSSFDGARVTNIGAGAFRGLTQFARSAPARVPFAYRKFRVRGPALSGKRGVSRLLRTIGACAFRGCARLRAALLPKSLSVVGAYAFSGCDALAELRLPSSLKRLGTAAFSDATR